MPEWERVRLGEVMKRSRETVEIHPQSTYKQVTVRMKHKGVVLREEKSGAAINTPRQFPAQPGQFIISSIDARNGANGLIPDELGGAVVTNDFWLFNVNSSRLDREWLNLYAATSDFVEACTGASEGTTNRVRLKETPFLALEIPLPSLPEQRRIVARVKGLLEKVEEARRLREAVQRDAAALAWSIHNAESTELVTMRELVALRPPNIQVNPTEKYHFAGVYSFGRGVFVGQSKLGADFAYPRLTRLATGDFTYPKLMAWEGALGLVPPECDGLVVSTEFPVFNVNSEKVLPEVLDAHFKNPAVWPLIAGESTGTNVRRRRLNPSDFLAYQFPLPTQRAQAKIALAWRTAEKLKDSDAVTSQLNALPASILAQAFAGAL